MLINKNNFMKLILLSTITFGIAFACTEKEKKAACYGALKWYCNTESDEDITNTQCAKGAIITYSQDQEQSIAVNTFFTDVILPNTANRIKVPPVAFCNIKKTGILPEYSRRNSVFGRTFGLRPLFDDEMCLLQLEEKLITPDDVQQCLGDLKAFRDYYDNEGAENMLKFAMLEIAESKLDNEDIYGKIYLEYISKTITKVAVENPKTDTPHNFCYKFDYKNGKRAIAEVNQSIEYLE